MRFFICIVLLSLFLVVAPVSVVRAADLDAAVMSLDSAGRYFRSLHCAADDGFCYWLRLHVALGDESTASMAALLRYMPMRGHGFMGEGHIAQVACYAVIRSDRMLDSQLSDGRTLAEYIYGTDWAAVYAHLQNPELLRQSGYVNDELSWYQLLARRLGDLPYIHTLHESPELSCATSHAMAATPEQHREHYMQQITAMLSKKKYMLTSSDPEFFLVTHAVESLMLSDSSEYISSELIDYSCDYTDQFLRELRPKIKQYPNPHDLIDAEPDLAYRCADVFGHLRHGLRLLSM